MPYKPKQPCAYPSCPRLSDGRYCEEHRKLISKSYERYGRGYDVHKRYGKAWSKVRERYVSQHPFCERCFDVGKLTPVQEVHHIRPLSKGGTHAEENLMSLCKSCHTKLHFELGDRKN